jgi:hypothetical protein
VDHTGKCCHLGNNATPKQMSDQSQKRRKLKVVPAPLAATMIL